MSSFRPPIQDMAFVVEHLAGLPDIAALPGCDEAGMDLVTAVLAEAGRFAAEVLAPLDHAGDRQGCRLSEDGVVTPDGFRAAYGRFVEGGWNAVPFDPHYGGQGLPWLVAIAVQELWHAANMSFALTPMLTAGAVEALHAHGSEALKRLYLPRLVSGEWTGTMNLTEPSAGSDVGALKTRAVPQADGTYRLFGQKIFITSGDHDLAANIVHLVLARLPESPPGVKGITLFLVPKLIPDAAGNPGARNDVACIRLEEKLGIHASPTCVMAYGESDGAVGWLVGEENKGLALMFTMMNNARLAVGLEGVAQAERASAKAAAFARERVQGGVAIVHHPDVRRMLLTNKALTEAARALAYVAAGRLDIARHHPDAAARARAQAVVDLLIPVVKAWCTDVGFRVADTALQVFGGMGYIEETGIAQHLRDVRVAAIYEGTNGIQAMDLVGRKLLRDDGRAFGLLMAEIRATEARLEGPDWAGLRVRLGAAADAAEAAARHLLDGHGGDPHLAGSVARPFLDLLGITAGGWLMAEAALKAAALAAKREASPFLAAKQATARFYGDAVLPRAAALLAQIEAGSTLIMAFDEDQL
ncbi:acyl-CoA dehydrogenase [Magnetospirillum sp. UT-4]|uniref:acyl-CoA dehydrogenase n=1 Tax=Magnetospirillum sp. UT-4 TaxID=2681467 RepID=UPI0013829583|nr:acyl-CoA dehydrogenase [Magnetospirillum sp. UT-4]CAA7614663.1 putative Acyl-CoA dehydrogenase [Magnetospirillum sp. UT-4]